MAPLMSLATAERIIESGRAEALSIGQPMNIAIVDEDHRVAGAGRKAFLSA